jgi:hypothetical protein
MKSFNAVYVNFEVKFIDNENMDECPKTRAKISEVLQRYGKHTTEIDAHSVIGEVQLNNKEIWLKVIEEVKDEFKEDLEEVIIYGHKNEDVMVMSIL